ncbi:hypothetical protein HD598_002174 [Neomicrococcus aestuarii]|uniref:Uncharacterized protein n=1 Tax=Neomicrococcus aestuarii TaxID=556325 RepID=A0A7W8X0Q7_9MICC|nr:hypothetical protein [Neomicrococcus aestuarii]MBB5513487.1 hypothetical protein [Neomicrococcus aestuarii]
MRNPLADIMPATSSASDSWIEATVTQVSPLKVHLITDDDPSDAEPIALNDMPLAAGDRVWVQIRNRRLFIIGLITPRETSGTIAGPALTWASTYSPAYVATANVSTPYAPPEGYGFQVYTTQTSGWVWVSVAAQTESTVTLRVFTYDTTTPPSDLIVTLGWRLVRI